MQCQGKVNNRNSRPAMIVRQEHVVYIYVYSYSYVYTVVPPISKQRKSTDYCMEKGFSGSLGGVTVNVRKLLELPDDFNLQLPTSTSTSTSTSSTFPYSLSLSLPYLLPYHKELLALPYSIIPPPCQKYKNIYLSPRTILMFRRRARRSSL